MTLITKVPLQMPFLGACTCASILCLCNCPSELLGSRHGSWGSLHSSEEKAAPSLWKSSSGSSGFPGHCPGGVCAPWPQGTCPAAVTWVTLSLPRAALPCQIFTSTSTCELLFTSDGCLGQSWRLCWWIPVRIGLLLRWLWRWWFLLYLVRLC